MAEKVLKLGIQRDNKGSLYYVDGQGTVWAKPKKPKGAPGTIIRERAVDRDKQYIYFVDKEGDVSRAKRAHRKKAEPAVAS